jgi:hypothetical protein
MTDQTFIPAMQRGLPQLSGRPLWTYRIVWAILAAATLATVILALSEGGAEPIVAGLRVIKSLIVGTVAAVLFWRRQRDPVSAILSLAFLCWTITSTFDFTTGALLPMLLDRLRFLLFATALLLFPDGKWHSRWTVGVGLLSILVFALGSFEGLGIVQTQFFLPFAIFCILASIVALAQRFWETKDETQQQQLKWVSLGLVTGVGAILMARAGAALTSPNVAFEASFQIGVVLIALGFLVPLLRYRLYDAEAVISRSAAYAALTAALIATFAGSEAIIETLGQQYLGSSVGQVSGAVAAAVAAILLTPLNQRINSWAERRFQQDLVQLRVELPALVSDTPFHWTASETGQALLPKITEAVHATFGAIILRGVIVATEGAVPNNLHQFSEGIALKLALQCAYGEHGWLLLGPRPDGSTYGKDDIEALRDVLPVLRRALLMASERERFRREGAEFRTYVQEQIANLRGRLSEIELRMPQPNSTDQSVRR